jgi:uncharacterized membrane protein YraQ (UPF0718 family)
MKFLKRYMFTIISVVGLILLYIIVPVNGTKAVDTVVFSFKELILIIPPIFILLGFLDVWVPRATIIKHMGNNSGIKGAALSILLGTAAAGPLYAAFPIASIFLRKGVKFTNVMLFIGAWSTTKIPMFLFEVSSLGFKFAFTRLMLSIIGIFIIAYVMNKLLGKEDISLIYRMNSEESL